MRKRGAVLLLCLATLSCGRDVPAAVQATPPAPAATITPNGTERASEAYWERTFASGLKVTFGLEREHYERGQEITADLTITNVSADSLVIKTQGNRACLSFVKETVVRTEGQPDQPGDDAFWTRNECPNEEGGVQPAGTTDRLFTMQPGETFRKSLSWNQSRQEDCTPARPGARFADCSEDSPPRGTQARGEFVAKAMLDGLVCPEAAGNSPDPDAYTERCNRLERLAYREMCTDAAVCEARLTFTIE